MEMIIVYVHFISPVLLCHVAPNFDSYRGAIQSYYGPAYGVKQSLE